MGKGKKMYLPVLVTPKPELFVKVLGQQVFDVGSGDFGWERQHSVVLADVLLGVDTTGHDRSAAFYNLHNR